MGMLSIKEGLIPAVVEIDIPEILLELTATFYDYECALIENDIQLVNGLFWNSSSTVRFGTLDYERQYGYPEIAAFRIQRGAVNQPRVLSNTRITTFGRDFGITSTEFRATGSSKIGRQSQTWVRTDSGWKIVSAHVSFGLI